MLVSLVSSIKPVMHAMCQSSHVAHSARFGSTDRHRQPQPAFETLPNAATYLELNEEVGCRMMLFGERRHVRSAMRWAIASVYSLVGFVHLIWPEKLLLIVPDWVPMPNQVILATGIFEIIASLALLTKPFRKWAGIAMACYALCVWPANFKHAFEGIQIPDFPNNWFYHAPRLLLQPVIMWWALYAADAIDWPWVRDERPS